MYLQKVNKQANGIRNNLSWSGSEARKNHSEYTAILTKALQLRSLMHPASFQIVYRYHEANAIHFKFNLPKWQHLTNSNILFFMPLQHSDPILAVQIRVRIQTRLRFNSQTEMYLTRTYRLREINESDWIEIHLSQWFLFDTIWQGTNFMMKADPTFFRFWSALMWLPGFGPRAESALAIWIHVETNADLKRLFEPFNITSYP